MKNFKTAVLLLFTPLLISACSNKVITVADIKTDKGQETEYIQMDELELKETEESSGRESIKYCAVMIPAGYHESSEVPGMYLHDKSPLDSSNIYYTVSQGSENGQIPNTLTKETYQEAIEEAYKDSGKKIKLNVETFEEIDMEGIPAFKIRSSFETDNNVVEQLAYLILTDQTYTVTYSQSADDELLADFQISDGEIKLVREES